MKKNDPIEVYKQLLDGMPSIGFINRNKRIKAYLYVTNKAQKMIEADEITEEEALFILSIMTKKSNKFRKSATITALSLSTLPKGVVKSVGFHYANQMRCNLNLHPADDLVN
ncbi:MAG: hypothetical protein KAG10_02985 [Methylococcales bacterium]|nr:hypothetical protein [Methylococcales bacterium]MCK5924837.1 hypothetical protein [Methylococcales bacterium]